MMIYEIQGNCHFGNIINMMLVTDVPFQNNIFMSIKRNNRDTNMQCCEVIIYSRSRKAEAIEDYIKYKKANGIRKLIYTRLQCLILLLAQIKLDAIDFTKLYIAPYIP